MPPGFEWDAAKNAANVAKHGINFEDAARIFEGPVLEQIDIRRDYGEERIIAFGEGWQRTRDCIQHASGTPPDNFGKESA